MSLNNCSVLTPEAELFIRDWMSALPFVIAHTSGSTGTPKEICLSKADMRASARATNSFFGINSRSRLLLPLSTSYIAGKMQIVRAIEAGCTIIVEQASNRPFQAICCGHYDMIPLVPSQLEGFLKSPVSELVEHVIVGGSPLSIEQERKLISRGIKAYVTYGMTETCSHVALRQAGSENYVALPGFTFSTDNRGCLVIDSDTMSFGRLTTNDIVRLISPHEMVWLGRADNVINSGGEKIHPEEIERTLAPLLPPDVIAYVSSRHSDKWGQEAVIVTDSSAVNENIIDRLRSLVPSHHVPHAVIKVDKIPLTSSGKIIRQTF